MTVVHAPGRRIFSQNLAHVYKDGILVKTASLRCPSLSEVRRGAGGARGSGANLGRVGSGAPVFPPPRVSDFASGGCAAVGVPGRHPRLHCDLTAPPTPQPFSSCCIGSAGHRTTTTTTGLPAPPVPSALAHTHPSLTRSQSFPATMELGWGSGLTAPLQEGSISSTLAGTQDTRWGSPTSLEGELGAVAIFHEALQAEDLKVLCTLGMQRPPPGLSPSSGVPESGGWDL